MDSEHQHFNDEIDLLELFHTLWDGKWTIIVTTFLAAVIGIVFSIVKPNSFEVSTPIHGRSQSVFLQYTPLNNLLKEEGILFNKKTNPNGFAIDSDSLFQHFIIEFIDYEEIIDAVKASDYVKENIKDLDEIDKKKALIKFAKSFELKAPSKNEEIWVLSFEWHDDLEGVHIFNNAIQKILINIRDVLKENVDELAAGIDTRNSYELDSLRNELDLITQKKIDRDKKRIQFLTEQSDIAKELGIETNRLEANALSQSSQSGISLSVNSSDVPFYLRGYKAIDKEISLIQNRSHEEALLMTSGYIEGKEKIVSLEKDLSSSQLREASKLIGSDNINDWVEFDLAIADVESQKKPLLYVALSIIIGGMIGVFYVLISSAVRNRKHQKTT